MKDRPIKLVCQQCGEEWVGDGTVMKCSHCNQWSKGIPKAEYDQIERLLSESIARGKRAAE